MPPAMKSSGREQRATPSLSPHDCRTMVLHRALADLKICSDILAGLSIQHAGHDLPLSRRELCQRRLSGQPSVMIKARFPLHRPRALNAGQQIGEMDGLLV